MGKARDKGQPQESHYCQTNAYACAINDKKIPHCKLDKIDRILIIYIERGRPHILWEPMQVPVSRSVYRQTLRFVKLGKQSLKTRSVPRGFCLTAQDGHALYCPWKSLCFSNQLDTMLSQRVLPELKFKP